MQYNALWPSDRFSFWLHCVQYIFPSANRLHALFLSGGTNRLGFQFISLITRRRYNWLPAFCTPLMREKKVCVKERRETPEMGTQTVWN
jgi:hypothetical protein